MRDNYVILKGNLGSDGNFMMTEKNIKLNVLSIAINNNYYDQDKKIWVDREATWVDVLCFNGMADKVSLLKKGERVSVEARVSVIKKENEKGESIKQYSFIATNVEKVIMLRNASMDGIDEEFINNVMEKEM